MRVQLTAFDPDLLIEHWVMDWSFHVLYHQKENTWSNPQLENFTQEIVQALNNLRDHLITKHYLKFVKL